MVTVEARGLFDAHDLVIKAWIRRIAPIYPPLPFHGKVTLFMLIPLSSRLVAPRALTTSA